MSFRQGKVIWIMPDVLKKLQKKKIDEDFKSLNDVINYLLSKEQGSGSPELHIQHKNKKTKRNGKS